MASTFDTYAATYSEDVRSSIGFAGVDLDFFTRAKAEILIDLIGRRVGKPRDTSVLDVGCGPGLTDSLLLGAVGGLSGVDTSHEMIREASTRNPLARYLAYEGRRLPFPDGTFDVAFAICVMHHVPPVLWDTFVAELHRVTRRGGMVAVFEHNPLHPLTRRAVDRCPFDEDAVLLPRSRVAGSFERAGGFITDRRYILFIPAGGRRTRRAERLLGWTPAGAQYVVASRVA